MVIVVDALGHHPREFLQAGVAVELERIEIGVLGAGLRDARLHLHFGLISTSRSWLRRRITFSVRSSSERRRLRSSPSTRLRATPISPAWLTKRSLLGAYAQGGVAMASASGKASAPLRRRDLGGGRLEAGFAEGELVDHLLAAVDTVRERPASPAAGLARARPSSRRDSSSRAGVRRGASRPPCAHCP